MVGWLFFTEITQGVISLQEKKSHRGPWEAHSTWGFIRSDKETPVEWASIIFLSGSDPPFFFQNKWLSQTRVLFDLAIKSLKEFTRPPASAPFFFTTASLSKIFLLGGRYGPRLLFFYCNEISLHPFLFCNEITLWVIPPPFIFCNEITLWKVLVQEKAAQSYPTPLFLPNKNIFDRGW